MRCGVLNGLLANQKVQRKRCVRKFVRTKFKKCLKPHQFSIASVSLVYVPFDNHKVSNASNASPDQCSASLRNYFECETG